MTKPLHRAVILSTGILILPACVTTREEGDALRRDVRALKEQLGEADEAGRSRSTSLETRLREAEDKVRALDAAQKQQDEHQNRRGADLGTEVQTLQEQFAQLKGALETKEYQLRERELQLGASQDQVQALEARVAELEKKLLALEARPVAAATPPPAAATPAPAAPAKPAFPADRQALYDFAKKAFDDGDFPQSREGFDRFIKQFPKDKELLDNAYFWLGENHFKENHFDKAILAYQKVITDHPKSEKADACLYKMGQSFSALGYDDDARVFYDELLQKHPKSPLVKDTRARLEELLKKKKAKAPAGKKR